MDNRQPNPRTDKLAPTFEKALTPIFVFALPNAIVCWTAAWVFKETYAFSALLLSLGAFPIVVAVCAYLLVLVNKVGRGS
ncbi:hypothetical protein [Bradyrhizobium sp. LHD-71]|uniref:hypothetical protein n=1 Tax=Bradyrhizobium sp. LHD-71 TaxID=3072141 RepID=UPI00280DE8C9|nr:hypothetical protein [Bradyrhizobium sp. LHD-71]MDQ8732661.1 hypothetical protein [Bradyrhizobium sp. LHD-71]